MNPFSLCNKTTCIYTIYIYIYRYIDIKAKSWYTLCSIFVCQITQTHWCEFSSAHLTGLPKNVTSLMKALSGLAQKIWCMPNRVALLMCFKSHHVTVACDVHTFPLTSKNWQLSIYQQNSKVSRCTVSEIHQKRSLTDKINGCFSLAPTGSLLFGPIYLGTESRKTPQQCKKDLVYFTVMHTQTWSSLKVLRKSSNLTDTGLV